MPLARLKLFIFRFHNLLRSALSSLPPPLAHLTVARCACSASPPRQHTHTRLEEKKDWSEALERNLYH